MQDMMQNPSMQKLMDNPEFLDSALAMMKSPMGKQQLEQMSKQTGMSPDTMLRLLGWFVSLAKVYKNVRPVLPVIKYGLIILVGSYLLKWLGLL